MLQQEANLNEFYCLEKGRTLSKHAQHSNDLLSSSRFVVEQNPFFKDQNFWKTNNLIRSLVNFYQTWPWLFYFYFQNIFSGMQFRKGTQKYNIKYAIFFQFQFEGFCDGNWKVDIIKFECIKKIENFLWRLKSCLRSCFFIELDLN